MWDFRLQKSLRLRDVFALLQSPVPGRSVSLWVAAGSPRTYISTQHHSWLSWVRNKCTCILWVTHTWLHTQICIFFFYTNVHTSTHTHKQTYTHIYATKNRDTIFTQTHSNTQRHTKKKFAFFNTNTHTLIRNELDKHTHTQTHPQSIKTHISHKHIHTHIYTHTHHTNKQTHKQTKNKHATFTNTCTHAHMHLHTHTHTLNPRFCVNPTATDWHQKMFFAFVFFNTKDEWNNWLVNICTQAKAAFHGAELKL